MNQSFFEDQHIMMPSQLENFRFQTNLTYLESIITPTSLAADFCLVQPSMETNEGKDFTAEIIRESKIHRSSTTYWACGDLSDCIGTKRSGGDHDNFGVSSATKMKKINMKTRRKVRDPRFCFKTMSDVDVLDDGYKWRKYGQKVVKNTDHPRSYYRCTQENCRVKKRVERLAEDPRMVITTYEGRHIHSPSHDNDDQDSHQVSPQFNNFFW